MRPCDTVAKLPLPCAFYKSFKMCKMSVSEFGSVGMRRRMDACTSEFLAVVTESVVHGEYNVVTRPSFSVTRNIRQVEVNGRFANCVTISHTNLT